MSLYCNNRTMPQEQGPEPLLNNIQFLTEATSDIVSPSLNAHYCHVSAFFHLRKFSHERTGAGAAIFHGEKGCIFFKSHVHFLRATNLSQINIRITFFYVPQTSFLCSSHNNTTLNSYTKEHGLPYYC